MGGVGASTAQSLGNLKTADLWHPPVEDSDLVLAGGEAAQRQFTVANGIHCVTAFSQAPFEYRTQALFVLGDEHPYGSLSTRRP
jgi:hypothetical protein